MSKKITQMDAVTDLLDTDLVTGVDLSAAPASQNTKITKANLLKDTAKTADLGDSAALDVGTGAGDVAAGNAPAGAVTAHESTYNHSNINTTAQKAALNANAGLSGANPVASQSEVTDAVMPEPANDGNPKMRSTSGGVSAWVDSGDSAVLDVGQTTGTVAAGDDDRFLTAVEAAGVAGAPTPITGANPAASMADVGAAGGGDMTAAVYDPQTIQADAFARGNHTGTQTLATISDSGDAAALDVGQTTGTVAAGDDNRLLTAAQAAGVAAAPTAITVDNPAASVADLSSGGSVPPDSFIDGYTEDGDTSLATTGNVAIPLDGRTYAITPTGNITISADTSALTGTRVGFGTVVINMGTLFSISYTAGWYWPDGAVVAAPASGESAEVVLRRMPTGNIHASGQIMVSV